MDSLMIRDIVLRRSIPGTFDGIFLAELLLFGLATILFLFYFNRAFGFLVSAAINIYTWTFYSATFSAQAFQVSLLGGRIFFKGIRYQGQNETIIAHDGYITWRYWYRRVRRAGALATPSHAHTNEKVDQTQPATSKAPSAVAGELDQRQASDLLPCRITAKVRGLEWFVYNRSPAYDTILSTLIDPEPEPSEQEETSADDAKATNKKSSSSSPGKENASSPGSSGGHVYQNSPGNQDPKPLSEQEDRTLSTATPTLPAFLHSLPIRISGSRAAMVMGNKYTRSILVAKVHGFDGVIDARPAGQHDQYRQCFDFALSQGTISFKPNNEYAGSQLDHGARLWNHEVSEDTLPSKWAFSNVLRTSFQRARYPFRVFQSLFLKSRTSLASQNGRLGEHASPDITHPHDPHQARWLGLSRYLVDDVDGDVNHERWRAIEYARFETIADIQSMRMNFFWDVPGQANVLNTKKGSGPKETFDHVNGSKAPAYGLDVSLGGGTINYGPWADRQRAGLQSVFFPSTYSRAKVARPLEPGAWRISTIFEITITLDEAMVLRIHTREASKDWRWRHHQNEKRSSPKSKRKKSQSGDQIVEDANPDQEARAGGWMDVSISKNSTVVYQMDMFARNRGFRNSLQLDVRSPRISTSVNHDVLCRAHSLTMDCDLSNPLSWKQVHKWIFNITSHEFELFILRDHAFLLQDLINDWTSGPSNNYFEFVPFVYSLRLHLPGTKIYLNVNDSNIINSPSSTTDNTFLLVGADRLDADLSIPLLDYEPRQNSVPFDVDVNQMYLELLTPLWTTQRTFLDNQRSADLDHLKFQGSYNYCTSTSPSLTDTVLLDLKGSSLSLTLYGFLVRYFMNFKENYFGEELHFQTQEEFQEKLETDDPAESLAKDMARHLRPTNDLDVILTIVADDVTLALPSLLYSASEQIKLDTPSVYLDLRFTNYYMDMEADFSPLSLSKSSLSKSETTFVKSDANTQIFIDGVSIVGHRLFGLPPTEPTYVCNWDFDVGHVSGEASLDFLSNLIGAVRSFAYGFPDSENAISRLHPLVIHDIIFLRAKVRPVKLWVRVSDSAFLLSSGETSVTFNDWAGDHSSEKLVLLVPDVQFACVNASTISRDREKSRDHVDTYALLQTSVCVRLIEVKPDFEEHKKLQQGHLIVSDSRTHRTPWLVRGDTLPGAGSLGELPKNRPPNMPFPPMPEPVTMYHSETPRSGSLHQFSLREFEPESNHKKVSLKQLPDQAIEALGDSYQFEKSQHKNSPELYFSAFATPRFPLLAVDPSHTELPALPQIVRNIDLVSASNEEDLPAPEKNVKTQVLMVTLDEGVRMMFTPQSAYHMTTLLHGLQRTDIDRVLDSIQISTMDTILLEKRPKINQTLQVRCEIPCAAIRFRDYQPRPDKLNTDIVSYDLTLKGFLLTLANKNALIMGSSKTHFSLQGRLDNIRTDVIFHYADGLQKAVSQIELNNISCWALAESGLSASLHIGELTATVFSRDTQLVAKIINQALQSIQLLSEHSDEGARSPSNLQKPLVLALATRSNGLPEAPFMTTTSFTLRTATFNPRNNDSWKLGSRLRWVLHRLSEDEKASILNSIESTTESKANGARANFVSLMQEWRGWDLLDPGSSVYVNNVFGPEKPSTSASDSPLSLLFYCAASVGRLEFLVDPGSRQDSLSLDLISCTASNGRCHVPANSETEIEPVVSVTLFCKKSELAIRWGMVEMIAEITKQVKPPNNPEPVTGGVSTEKQESTLSKQDFHIVIAVEQAISRIETINLALSTRCFGLTGSIVSSKSPSDQLNEVIMLHSNHIISELSTQQNSIVAYKLQRPSIHLSRTLLINSQSHPVMVAGGFCENLELHITQDMLSIIGIVDHLISDEIHFLNEIRQHESKKPKTPTKEQGKNKTPVEFHLGLLLESYGLSAKVLSTLQYAIEGKYARSACHSVPGESQMTNIDFDVDTQVHSFTNHENDEPRKIASLSLPPLNGSVSIAQSKDQTKMDVVVALEQIVLDASSLHALFTTFSRSELSSFRGNVARDLKYLKSNYENLIVNDVSPIEDAQENTSSKLLLYKAQISAAGLKIKARTSRASSYSARLTFDLGHLRFHILNADGQKKLPFPEMKADFRPLRIILKRFEGSRSHRCGDFSIAGSFIGTSKPNERNQLTRSYEVITTELDINIYPETASTVVDIIGYVQQRFKSFNLSEEISTLTIRARRLRAKSRTFRAGAEEGTAQHSDATPPSSLFSSMYSLEMNMIYVAWHVGDEIALASPTHDVEDLRFSIAKVHLSTRRGNSARLTISDLQLQLAPRSLPRSSRSDNSALLPEVAFNVAYFSTSQDRRFAFQAVGKVLDLQLTTQAAKPAVNLQKSIALATRDLRKVVADWNAAFVKEEEHSKNILGQKALSSVLVAADFAGAVVHISGKGTQKLSASSILRRARTLQDDGSPSQNVQHMDLQAPGISLKVEYRGSGSEDPSLNTEIRIDASSNILHPAVVPLFYEMSESVRQVMGEHPSETAAPAAPKPPETTGSDPLASADPTAILGSTRLNLGLRVCKQQFGLTCQPIARVVANAQFDDIYITINTVQSTEQGRFFALSASILKLETSLQHVYSREATGNFSIERVTLSLMNSKHVSNMKGLSAILKISPMLLNINAKQMHDFFLFKEIWIPSESVAPSSTTPVGAPNKASFGVRKYQEVAATSAFPWNASINIEKMEVQLDLGQSLGKSSFSISELWISSKKTSDWEQSLCVAFGQISIHSVGRLSGFIELRSLRVQTSIHWPDNMVDTDRTPLIEASTAVGQLHGKLAFEYQAFLVLDLSALEFLMYNVRDRTHASGDRLVCLVEGNNVHAFCTTQSSAQCVALFQAIQRLIQEKRAAYENSLKDVEKLLQRKPSLHVAAPLVTAEQESKSGSEDKHLIPLQLQTNVMVSLKAVKVGAYPRTFFDAQIFKVEALDASTRFAVAAKDGQVQSKLGLSLGQVRVALSNPTQRVERKSFENMEIAEVVAYSTGSRGGTVLKVPRLKAEMQTWQATASYHIDYLFRSSFEGKIEVGWNYSRISYIRGMWASHARSLAQRLGKPLPTSAVQITGGLEPSSAPDGDGKEQEKITAVVNVPLSKYEYTALEPPVIVTPQLRDMGEATPPLEWIGLQRDRLPHLTHQIVIVPLLEVAKEVEDAYSTILGSS